MDTGSFATIIGPIVGTVIVVGLALAGLIMRGFAGIRNDMRAHVAESAADRREAQRRFDTAMDAFRAEMQRLAERQSHVEGRIDERGGAAAD